MTRTCAPALVLAAALATFGTARAEPVHDAQAGVPAGLRGPFVSDPEVLRLLDCPTEACDGPLNFARLLQARVPGGAVAAAGNPFNLPIAKEVLTTIQADLKDVRVTADAVDGQLSERFLTDNGSRVELVGVVNRMDRQNVKDPTLKLSAAQLNCGEISLIYRFSYSIRGGTQRSRLPVTMNIVLPALPYDTRGGAVTCQGVAQRWLAEVTRPTGRTPAQVAADLMDANAGPLAFLAGGDMLRLELNMQAYRKSASSDMASNGGTNFGTEAGYLIRVFKWSPEKKVFLVHFLRNQIDRGKVLCGGNAKACQQAKERRTRLVRFLQQPKTLSALDKGTLEVPFDLGVLAERAVSVSPGGFHRSINQPYWNARNPKADVITDAEIDQALAIARQAKVSFSFIKSRDDFRTRLNESSCTGCHQTRAIAGFHFPGADRADTPAANAVLLPGSPHFYGDQARRMEILDKMAKGPSPRLTEHELASGYSARPMNRFAAALVGTELIGGWGGTCLIDEALAGSQRQWTCRGDLTCRQLFKSDNDPQVGTCVPKQGVQVGDALQLGTVKTSAFGKDLYVRTAPVSGDTRIPASALPPSPPPGNSYYGAHQEFYPGKPTATDRDERRDAQTGGFPAGMLRLSECVGLPNEASCGLIASSGFNSCIGRIGAEPDYTIDACFAHFTSYSGLRACDAAAPCRDDYICVRPMGYTRDTAVERFKARKALLKKSLFFRTVNRRCYDPNDYGQAMPDAAWVAHNDRRGLCIPPYFVFQFRSDGHPAPPRPTLAGITPLGPIPDCDEE